MNVSEFPKLKPRLKLPCKINPPAAVLLDLPFPAYAGVFPRKATRLPGGFPVPRVCEGVPSVAGSLLDVMDPFPAYAGVFPTRRRWSRPAVTVPVYAGVFP